MVRNSWIALTYLRSCDGCLDEGNSYKVSTPHREILSFVVRLSFKVNQQIRNFTSRYEIYQRE